MPADAASQRAAGQYADGVHGEQGRERDVGDRSGRAVQRAKRDHEIRVEPIAYERSQNEKGEVEQDGGREQKLPAHRSGRGAFPASAGATLLGNGFRLREQYRKNDKPKNSGADIGAAPAKVTLHRQERHRRDGGAEHTGEGVESKNLTQSLRRRVIRK